MAPNPDPELALLRLLVRGQIHKANNLLSTLHFAIEAFLDDGSRPEFEQLAGELTALLKDLRCAAAPSSELGKGRPWTPALAAAAALRLAAAAVQRPGRLRCEEAPGFPINGEQAWALLRGLSALLTGEEKVDLELAPSDEPGALILRGAPEGRRAWLRALFEAGGWRWREEGGALRLDAAGPGPSTEQAPGAAPPRSLRRLLVLDDSAPVRTYLKLVLRKGGFEAGFAGRSDEALAMAEQGGFDAYLIDRNLAEDDACRDGLEAATRLRAIKPGPVIIMSGSEASKPIRDAIARGEVLAYLTKPFDLRQLIRCLRGSEAGVAPSPDEPEGGPW